MIPTMINRMVVIIQPHLSFAGVQRRREFGIELSLDKEVMGPTES